MIKRMRYILIISAIVALGFGLSIYADTTSQHVSKKVMPAQKKNGYYEINLKMGGSLKDMYIQNSSIFEGEPPVETAPTSDIGVRIDRPNIPMSEDKLIKLQLQDQQGRTLFNIDHIRDLMITSDRNHFKEGITDIDFSYVCSDRSEIGMEEMYQCFNGFVSNLKENGWRNYFPLMDARIKRKDTVNPKLKDINTGVDVFYFDNFDKWKDYYKDIENIRDIWLLEKNGIVLIFSKDVAAIDTAFSVQLLTQFSRYYYRYDIDEDIRAKEWKKYLQKDLQKWKNERNFDEEKVKRLGFEIDESYQDTPLKFAQ
ncbi:hypothetical protein [Acinetobacter sp. MB5]|uniref:hypothetical protein n=1 Tax=Acinetobacter sp. MB5 TaxID=2069438 RepID=UPI000DD0ECD0|nr:hypothetical protein [Acinetobacter sp. MB5]